MGVATGPDCPHVFLPYFLDETGYCSSLGFPLLISSEVLASFSPSHSLSLLCYKPEPYVLFGAVCRRSTVCWASNPSWNLPGIRKHKQNSFNDDCSLVQINRDEECANHCLFIRASQCSMLTPMALAKACVMSSEPLRIFVLWLFANKKQPGFTVCFLSLVQHTGSSWLVLHFAIKKEWNIEVYLQETGCIPCSSVWGWLFHNSVVVRRSKAVVWKSLICTVWVTSRASV